METSKEHLANLEHLSNLLHLFNHRNKNQHRRSIWWRHFSIFRRHLNHIIEDYGALNEVPSTHLERARKRSKNDSLRIRISQRLTLWQDILAPKWHHAFSQLVADGRFAALGVMLLAVLSQTCQILGLVEAFDELGQAEVEKAIEDFGKEYWADNDHPGGVSSEGEDLGVVIEREDPSTAAASTTWLDEQHRPFGAKAAPSKRKAGSSGLQQSSQKKKSKGNAG